jgi:hypothetical protein
VRLWRGGGEFGELFDGGDGSSFQFRADERGFADGVVLKKTLFAEGPKNLDGVVVAPNFSTRSESKPKPRSVLRVR